MKSVNKTPGYVFDVDYHNFDQLVIQASHEKPVLVDLWAEWCSPCLVIAPLLQQLVEEYEGEILLGKVEVDKGDGENMKLAGHFRVRGFPTVILFAGGEEKARFSGAKPLSFLRQFVDDHNFM
jgi:putative thioredoxin